VARVIERSFGITRAAERAPSEVGCALTWDLCFMRSAGISKRAHAYARVSDFRMTLCRIEGRSAVIVHKETERLA